MEKRSKKWMFISIISVALLIIGGFQMLLFKTGEERHNREYEMSLVDTLKDTYEGIDRVEFTNPNYTSPPGSWTCVINLYFKEKSIKYKINYSIEDKRISDISLERENRIKDRNFLNSHIGKTTEIIKVKYSDGSEEEK